MPYLTLASSIEASRRAVAGGVTLALEFEGQVAGDPLATSMVWLHAVEADGGDDEFVLSYASGSRLYMGRLDLRSSANLASVGWTQVPLSTLVTDTWHVFQRGEHWVSVYSPSTGGVTVARVGTDFRSLVGEAVVPVRPNYLRNDHFLAASPGGAVVGVADRGDPRSGPRVVAYQLNANLDVVDITRVEAVGDIINMSSARRVELYLGGFGQGGLDWSSHARWLLVGPDSAPEGAADDTGLVGAFVDRDWVAVQPLFAALTDGRYAIGGQLLYMATAVAFENGHVLVTYVRAPTAGGVAGGRGTVARALFDRTGALVGPEEVLVADVGSRPHTVRVGDRLVTTWDQQAAERQPLTGHARVETITLG